MSGEDLVYRRGKVSVASNLSGRHGLSPSTGIIDDSKSNSMRDLSVSRGDPLKKALERREVSSFAGHVAKVKEVYKKSSQMDMTEMIKAKRKSDGEAVEQRAPEESLYDESISDVMSMIKARRKKEAAESGVGEGEENSDSGSLI
jgi:hypothetical protein